MKKMLLLLLLFTVFIQAQPPVDAPPFPNSRDVENFRIYKLTETLELTPEQSDKFFPRLRQQHKKRIEIRKQIQKLERDYYKGTSNRENNEQLNGLIEKIQDLDKQQIDLKYEFINEIQGFLEPWQVERYLFFEEQFRKDLRKQFKSKMNKNRR